MGTTYQTTVVAASADAVWAKLRNFYDMSWAPNVVTECRALAGGDGSTPGAVRLLNGVFKESLLQLDDETRTLRYSIDDGPSPVGAGEVDEYQGMIRVLPVTHSGHSFVEWSSSWHRNDEAVKDFCSTIYSALLAELKNYFNESQSAA